MTHGKTYNKSPRRINHKATKSKTNTGTTALERSVEQTTVGFKALLQLANFTLGPDATPNTEIQKYRNPSAVYSTDRSKAVVPVLVLLFAALWFIVRGDLFYVLPYVIFFKQLAKCVSSSSNLHRLICISRSANLLLQQFSVL